MGADSQALPEVSWFNQTQLQTQASGDKKAKAQDITEPNLQGERLDCAESPGQESPVLEDEGSEDAKPSGSPEVRNSDAADKKQAFHWEQVVQEDSPAEPAIEMPCDAPELPEDSQKYSVGDAEAAIGEQPSSPINGNGQPTAAKAGSGIEEGGSNKENTPAAANAPDTRTPAASKGKKDSKRKSSGTRSSHPSTGKRSGKKQKAILAQEACGMSFQWRSVSLKGADGLPEERWGATLTAASDNKAWLFGGNSAEHQLGDVWAVDLAAGQWCKLSNDDDQVKAWHQANLVATDQGKHLYVFGGERVIAGPAASDAEEDDDLICLSDVCQFDPETKMWMQLPISGTKLCRAGHSTTLLPDGRILSFGGIDADGKHRNDAHIIDLHHLNCFPLSNVVRGAPPKPRAYHSATLVGNNIIVLGGDGTRVWSLKEVYSLSIETWHWKEHTADVEGDAPSPRSGHSAVALPGDRYLLVFGGGIPAQNTFFGSVSVLDTCTWTWSTPIITGVERPRGRSGQGMAVIHTADGKHVVALHGGRTHEECLCRDTWVLERTS